MQGRIRAQGRGGRIDGGEDRAQGRGGVGVARSRGSRGQRRGSGVQGGERSRGRAGAGVRGSRQYPSGFERADVQLTSSATF